MDIPTENLWSPSHASQADKFSALAESRVIAPEPASGPGLGVYLLGPSRLPPFASLDADVPGLCYHGSISL
jgi:hypothetical protein